MWEPLGVDYKKGSLNSNGLNREKPRERGVKLSVSVEATYLFQKGNGRKEHWGKIILEKIKKTLGERRGVRCRLLYPAEYSEIQQSRQRGDWGEGGSMVTWLQGKKGNNWVKGGGGRLRHPCCTQNKQEAGDPRETFVDGGKQSEKKRGKIIKPLEPDAHSGEMATPSPTARGKFLVGKERSGGLT